MRVSSLLPSPEPHYSRAYVHAMWPHSLQGIPTLLAVSSPTLFFTYHCFHLQFNLVFLSLLLPPSLIPLQVCVDQLAGRASSTATRGGQTQRPTFQCPICRVWVNGDAVSLNVTLRDLLSELGRMDDKR